MITVGTLVMAGIQPTQALQFAAAIADACKHFSINTHKREAAFISQCAHESAGFILLTENLYYRSPDRIYAMFPSRVASVADAATLIHNPQAMANRVYENRLGNGDESSGDGWAYRGRGLIQLTGRANYRVAGSAIGAPYLDQPDLVLQPAHAAMTAAWFWAAGGCNALADAGNVTAITRVINGPALAGLDDRQKRYDLAIEAFA